MQNKKLIFQQSLYNDPKHHESNFAFLQGSKSKAAQHLGKVTSTLAKSNNSPETKLQENFRSKGVSSKLVGKKNVMFNLKFECSVCWRQGVMYRFFVVCFDFKETTMRII